MADYFIDATLSKELPVFATNRMKLYRESFYKLSFTYT